MAADRLCILSAVLLANASIPALAQPLLRLDATLDGKPRGRTMAVKPPPSLKLKPARVLHIAQAAPKPAPAPAVRSTEPPPPSPPATLVGQSLIVSVVANEVPKGERYARFAADGGILLRREDLREIVAAAAQLPAITIESEQYVDPRGLAGLQVRFDEATLTLHLRLPPAELPRQDFDLTAQRKPAELTDPPTSFLFAYRAGYWGSGGGAANDNLTLSTETAIAWRNWLLRNRTFHTQTDEAFRSARFETQLVRDDLENLRRLILGDFVTPALPLGSSVPIGGLSYAKSYLLSPYLIRHPTFAYQGMAESPSRIEFYVGNTMVLRRDVGPGPFDIHNFNYYGGQRDVRVVIRDALGREQTISQPFYFATEGLAEGLHDFAYQVGALRDDPERTRAAYGKAAYSAFHQYGFTDSLTLGFRSEGTRDAQNAGLDGYFRAGRLGSLGAHAAVSHDRERGSGSAVSLSYAFQNLDFRTTLIWQRYSENYAVLHGPFTPTLPRQDASANFGYTTRLGTFGLSLTHLQLHANPTVNRSTQFSWSTPLGRHASITSYVRRSWGDFPDTQLYVGLQYNPSIEYNAGLTYQRDKAGNATTSLEVSNMIPRGEGTAWSMGLQHQDLVDGQAVLAVPRVQWNGKYATVSAEASRLQGGPNGNTTTYALAVDGAFVATEGRYAFTRAIPNAFAIVETVPPMAGIRVYENAQEIGRTDAAGRVLLTNISPYATSEATIQDKDVPIEFAIDKVHKTFQIPARSGRVVPFSITRMRAFTGHFRYRSGERVLPLEFAMVTVTAGGRTFEAPTGSSGEFYVENLPPGRASASADIGGRKCEFTFEVPESDEAVVSLGNITGCDG